jgi:hypothetical protein
MAGDVSKNDDFYTIFQYTDILEDTADAIRRKQDDLDFSIEGGIQLADDYHKMRLESYFEGEDTMINLGDDDTMKVGLNIRSGHSGFHGLKVQPAAFREICSNGMKGWVKDTVFQLNHSEDYQPAIFEQGVAAAVEGTDVMEERLEAAQNEFLTGGTDELRIMMHDMIGEYLDTPVADIPLSIEAETSSDEVSLYEAYQSMTRALSHHARSDLPQYKVDDGFEKAAEVMDSGRNRLPNADRLGERAVEQRAAEVIEAENPELYFEDERETLQELMAEHELTA